MPITYEIIESERLVVARGSGEVSGHDVLAHLEELAMDERYTAPMKKFVDYRFVDGLKIPPEIAQQIASRKHALSEIFHGEKCAFVSPGDVTYGLSRVHQSLIDSADVNTGVFREIGEAWEWLGFESAPAID